MGTRFVSWLPVFACSLLLGCEFLTRPELEEDFRLAPGQSAAIAGTDLVITFRKVVDDSRCPSTVVCVWAGNGEVELLARTSAGGTTPQILGTPSGPLEAAVGPYRIRILGLDPYPEDPEADPIPPDSYRLSLRVSSE
jgi:hypothetical protein